MLETADISDRRSVAVTETTPVVSAVTRPDGDTDAVVLLDVAHSTRLVRSDVVPSENTPMAVSCCVSPAGRLRVDADNVSESSTAGTTVIRDVPEMSDWRSVAVTETTPAVSAVTKPEEDTEAVEVSELDQPTKLVRSDVVPSENRPVAVSCSVSPFGKLTVDDDSVSESRTAGNTVTLETADISDTRSVAVTETTPVPSAVTRPDGDTDAVELFDDDQLTKLVRSDVVPSENNPVAVSCSVSPFAKLTVDDDKLSESNTAGSTVTTLVPEISDRRSVAVIETTPVPSAVTRPDGDTNAVEVSELDQLTKLVRSDVVPSENRPVAASC
jgi:hypothetical protein